MRSGTRTCAIPVRIRRSSIERCGSKPKSSFRSTGSAPRATMRGSKRVPSSSDWSTRMAMGSRPVTHAKERENTDTTYRATSRPKDLRHRASAGGCLQENSKIESRPQSGKCSMTSQQFLRPLRKLTLPPARSAAYSMPREPGVSAFNQKPNRPPQSPLWWIGWSSNLTA